MRWVRCAEANVQEEAPCQAQSSSAVWAGLEQEGPRVNWGGVGVATSWNYTQSKVRRAFCLREPVCLILLPLPG